MIGYAEALEILLREAPAPQVQRTAPAVGQVLAEAVASPEALPPFDNSAMDGFALRVGPDGASAGAEFDVRGAQAAGDAAAVAGQGAWEIMTGARVPDGLDAVIPVEQVAVLARGADGRPRRIRLNADLPMGQHIRCAGEDLAAGALLLDRGVCLEAAQRMLLSAVGVAEVAAVRPPQLALINTGRELVDDPGQSLASGEIRNSNGPYLAQKIIDAGALLVRRATVGDDADAFLAALRQSLDAGARLLLSTGAVSMGRHDFVPDALRDLGATIHFHKVRIRPGKPLLFATLPDGQLFFGLPGNPVSSAVGMRFFVEPVLRRMLGLPDERPLRLPLAEPYRKRHPLRFHLKASVSVAANGRVLARILPGQESFRIAPMARSNAWIVLGEDIGDFDAGALVDVHGLSHWRGPQLTGN